MNQSIKQKFAKETIILSSVVLLIGLTWIILLTIDYFVSKKTEDLQFQITKISHRIETLDSPRSFQDIVTKKAPEEFIKRRKWDEDLISVDSANVADQRNINIFQLYEFLNLTDFPFLIDSGTPKFSVFRMEIEKELSNENDEQFQLKRIYDFLNVKRYLSIDEKEFISVLDFNILNPNKQLIDILVEKREDLKNELTEVNNKSYSSPDNGTLLGWISIILLIAVYPIRFLFFLLMWAIKTLMQK